jgi:hypothetical protein
MFVVDDTCVIRADTGEVLLRDRMQLRYECFRECGWVSYWQGCGDGRGGYTLDRPMSGGYTLDRPTTSWLCMWPKDIAGSLPSAEVCAGLATSNCDCLPDAIMVTIAPSTVPDGIGGTVTIAEPLSILCKASEKCQFLGTAVALVTTGQQLPVEVCASVKCNPSDNTRAEVAVRVGYQFSLARIVSVNYFSNSVSLVSGSNCNTSLQSVPLSAVVSAASTIDVRMMHGIASPPGGGGSSDGTATAPDATTYNANLLAGNQGLPAYIKWRLTALAGGVGRLVLTTRDGRTAVYETKSFSCIKNVTYTRISADDGLQMLPWCLCLRPVMFPPLECLDNSDHCKCCDPGGDYGVWNVCVTCPTGVVCLDVTVYRQSPTSQYPCGEFIGSNSSSCLSIGVKSRCVGEDLWEVLISCLERNGSTREAAATITSYDCTCYGVYMTIESDLDCACCAEPQGCCDETLPSVLTAELTNFLAPTPDCPFTTGGFPLTYSPGDAAWVGTNTFGGNPMTFLLDCVAEAWRLRWRAPCLDASGERNTTLGGTCDPFLLTGFVLLNPVCCPAGTSTTYRIQVTF